MFQSSAAKSVLGSLGALYLGAIVLFAGQGILLTLVPLSLDVAGYSAQTVSIVVSSYFLGVLAGAWYCDRIIRRVGHVRAYGGLIATVIVAVLCLPLLPNPYAWTPLRFFHGAAIAGVAMTIESWLNGVAPNQWRGRVLTTYTMTVTGAIGAAQLLLSMDNPETQMFFSLAAILLALSIVPPALSRIAVPKVESPDRHSQRDLLKLSPLGIAGAFAAGLTKGAFWALAPLFGASIGLDASRISMLVAAALLGGLCLEWPAGYVSDYVDRRKIILGAAVAILAVSLAIVSIGHLAGWPLFLLLALYGGGIYSLYPLSLAHAADLLPQDEDRVSVSRGLLLSKGLGLPLGPLLAGQLAEQTGDDGLFLFSATICATIAIIGLWQLIRHPARPRDEQGSYVSMHEATPAIFHLDPRVKTPQGELDFRRPADREQVSARGLGPESANVNARRARRTKAQPANDAD